MEHNPKTQWKVWCALEDSELLVELNQCSYAGDGLAWRITVSLRSNSGVNQFGELTPWWRAVSICVVATTRERCPDGGRRCQPSLTQTCTAIRGGSSRVKGRGGPHPKIWPSPYITYRNREKKEKGPAQLGLPSAPR